MSTSNYTMSQENKPLYSSLARDFAKCQPVFTARRYMLAQYMLSSRARPSVRPSVCLSVTSRCCIETTGRKELSFGMKASFRLSHTVL